jgi:hypothetical protein
MADLTIIAYVKEIDEKNNVVENYTIAAESTKQKEGGQNNDKERQ